MPKENKKENDVLLGEKEKKDALVIGEIIQNQQIQPQDAFGKMNRAQLDLIKRTVAEGASDDELRLFIQVCKGANLNPFLKQVHLVPFWDSKSGSERRTIIVGIDGYRAVAESGGQYAGNDDPIYNGENEIELEVWDKVGNVRKVVGSKKLKVPKMATSTVYKMLEGQRVPFTATARWDEYYPGGKKGARWQAMPYLMLGKCAEGLALRKAFPKLLSGMYVQEEMDQALRDDQPARPDKLAKAMEKTIAKMSLEELESFKEKIRKTEKYDDDQKVKFLEQVEVRIKEIKK